MYVKKVFVCNEIGDLEVHSTTDCVVESLWMEVCSGKDKTVIGGIYRHPSHNIKLSVLVLKCLYRLSEIMLSHV